MLKQLCRPNRQIEARSTNDDGSLARHSALSHLMVRAERSPCTLQDDSQDLRRGVGGVCRVSCLPLIPVFLFFYFFFFFGDTDDTAFPKRSRE